MSGEEELSEDCVPITCDQCEDDPPFPNMKLLMVHIRRTESHTPYCKICDIRFKEYKNLQEHKRLYHVQKEQAGEFPCETCGKFYSTSVSLNHHWKSVHKVQDNLNCNLCGMKCQNMIKLKRHTLMCLIKSPQFPAFQKAQSAQILSETIESNLNDEDESTGEPIVKRTSSTISKKVKRKKFAKKMLPFGVAHLVEPQLKSVENDDENDTKDEKKEALDEFDKTEVGEDWIKLETEPDQEEGEVCPYCGSEVKHLQLHIKAEHSEHVALEENHTCKECSKVFTSHKKLQYHIKSQHSENHSLPSNYPCKDCPKVFATQKKLYIHCYSAHRDLPSTCDICNKVFKNPSMLKSHKRQVHEKYRSPVKNEGLNHGGEVKDASISNNESEPKVEEDASKVKDEPELKADLSLQDDAGPNFGKMKLKHKKPPSTKMCPACGANVKNLAQHMKNQHSELPPEIHACAECPKIFDSSRKLYSHKYAAHTVDPSLCDICSQVFKNPSILRSHRRQVHEKDHNAVKVKKVRPPRDPKVCPICARVVRRLDSHIKDIHTETPPEHHPCGECGKVYESKRKLYHHNRVAHRML
eukprot:GFUD01032640.1.p1 GENE.GFUD01032640.1~~GFUD01032640.1.p1  ORF type:complete len:582 (-),score=127.32 GFUD01032640.1:104-1849(-)